MYVRPSLTSGQHFMLSRASALRRHLRRMHCVAPLGRRAYFPMPMPQAIPNMWPHPTTVPVPIRMSLPSRRAHPTILLRRSIVRLPTPRCPVLCRLASALPPCAATHGRLPSPPRLFSPTRNDTTTITLTFKPPLVGSLFNPPWQHPVQLPHTRLKPSPLYSSNSNPAFSRVSRSSPPLSVPPSRYSERRYHSPSIPIRPLPTTSNSHLYHEFLMSSPSSSTK
jgi:hypothetical protein